MPTQTYPAQRMQVNAAWSNVFQFTSGNPSVPVSLATWTLKGKAQRTNLPNNNLDLTTRMDLGTDTSQLIISLAEADTALLGIGKIMFEVLRVDPPPQIPILKFYVENKSGVVDG